MWMHLQQTTFENIALKGEIHHDQHFSLCPRFQFYQLLYFHLQVNFIFMFKSFQSRPRQMCCLRGGLIKTKYEVKISYGIAQHLSNPLPHADEFNASVADNF